MQLLSYIGNKQFWTCTYSNCCSHSITGKILDTTFFFSRLIFSLTVANNFKAILYIWLWMERTYSLFQYIRHKLKSAIISYIELLAAPCFQGSPQPLAPHVWLGRFFIPDALPDETLKRSVLSSQDQTGGYLACWANV